VAWFVHAIAKVPSLAWMTLGSTLTTLGDSIGPQICQDGDCAAEHGKEDWTGRTDRNPTDDKTIKIPIERIRLVKAITMPLKRVMDNPLEQGCHIGLVMRRYKTSWAIRLTG
jgi:hypothetical protein